MKTAVILHGTNADHTQNWFPWLKEKLENNNFKVWVPDLPGADKPNIARYTQFLTQNYPFELNSETILIGHSSGSVAILGLIQALPEGTRIGNCYLVSAFTHDLGWESLSDLFDPALDLAKIKGKARKLIFIHADDDPFCPLTETQALAEELNAEMKIIPGQKHFSISAGGEQYKQFPLLFELILSEK